MLDGLVNLARLTSSKSASAFKKARKGMNAHPLRTIAATAAVGAAAVSGTNYLSNQNMQQHQYHTVISSIPQGVPTKGFAVEDFYMLTLKNGNVEATTITPPYLSYMYQYAVSFNGNRISVDTTAQYIAEAMRTQRREVDSSYPNPMQRWNKYNEIPSDGGLRLLAVNLYGRLVGETGLKQSVDYWGAAYVADAVSRITGMPHSEMALPNPIQFHVTPRSIIAALEQEGKLDALAYFYPVNPHKKAIPAPPWVQASTRLDRL